MFSYTLGFEVSWLLCKGARAESKKIDAHIFYYLEAWVRSSTDSSSTVYLLQIQSFQRSLTTAAFKIAGGVDLSNAMSPSPKTVKQNQIATTFVTRIVKAFLDALYAFLDGLVHLASDEYPVVTGKQSGAEPSSMSEINPPNLLDLQNGVRNNFVQLRLRCNTFLLQDNRLLLVISNFTHLTNTLIPSMIGQLESAFSISVSEDKQVSLGM